MKRSRNGCPHAQIVKVKECCNLQCKYLVKMQRVKKKKHKDLCSTVSFYFVHECSS